MGSGRTEKPRSTYHHGDLKAALISAAAEVAATQGVEAIQMRDLARRLAVSSAAPFRHFADRKALLVAVAEAGLEKMLHFTETAVAQVTDPLEMARARGIAYVRFACEHPGYFRVMHTKESMEGSQKIQAHSRIHNAAMDQELGSPSEGSRAQALTQMTAATLAAQTMMYGLTRLIVDGMLGNLTVEDAVQLAHELTEVLGLGLQGKTDHLPLGRA